MTPEDRLRRYAERFNLQREDVEYVLNLICEAIKEEREACAQVADYYSEQWQNEKGSSACSVVASAIRARSTF